MNDFGKAGGQIPLEWHRPEGLWGLSFFIFFMRLITLGIYHFWGKTEVRRRIWSGVHLDNQPLEYTGTGKELFLGFLVVFFLIMVPIFLLVLVPFAAIVIYPLILYLVGVAVYRARNYRLTRTNWRGIRGGMSGSSWAFGVKYFFSLLLIPLTLGWITPWRNTMLYRNLTNDTVFGTEPLRFQANSGRLYGPYAGYWVGQIVLLGVLIGLGYLWIGSDIKLMSELERPNPSPQAAIVVLKFYGLFFLGAVLWAIIGAFYKAYEMNYFAGHTEIDNARFSLSASAGSLIGLVVTNALLVLFTLGIATPIAQSRLAGYIIERMRIHGSIDFAAIQQNQQKLGRTGEGLAEAFDVDAF